MKSLSATMLLLLAPLAQAAPKLDTLFPAGAERGTAVDVIATGTFASWPVQVWTSHAGIVVSPGKTPGQAKVAVAADVPCGVHWFRVFDDTGASGLRPFLVNQLPELEETEPNDDFAKPHLIAKSSVIINGRLTKNDDVDHFAVTLKIGQTLVAAIEAARLLRSPVDPVLQILSADGFVLAHNDDDRGHDPLIAFTARKDGDYVVRLFGFPAVADSRVGFFGKDTCIYRLTITTGPFIDRTWPLAVERGQPGEVELLGWNIPANRRTIKTETPPNDERVELQPPGFANGVSLRIESHRTLATESLGHPPVSVSGHLAKPGSRATFSFDAIKGKPLSIGVEAREHHLPLDAVLTIRSPAGKTLQKASSAKLNVDPALDFTPPEDGRYTLEVRDLHDGGGPRHTFLARIRPALPRFEITVAADVFQAATKHPCDIAVSVAFHDGMKGPLEFRAEGLPEAARVEFVPGKDLKKSTLRIEGLDKPFNGPVRLYVRSAGQPESRVRGSEWSLPYFWITASEPKK